MAGKAAPSDLRQEQDQGRAWPLGDAVEAPPAPCAVTGWRWPSTTRPTTRSTCSRSTAS